MATEIEQTVYMVDMGGKGQWGKHKCSVPDCKWQFPPLPNSIQSSVLPVSYNQFPVGEDFKGHVDEHTLILSFRQPRANEPVKVPGFKKGKFTVYGEPNIKKQTASVRSVDPPYVIYQDIEWAFLSYPK